MLDLPHDDHRLTAIACLSLYDLRMGQLEAALRWLDDPAFASGGRLHDMAVPHFVRACAHASLGDFAASAAALDMLVRTQANIPFDRGSDLVREAMARLAAARR